MIICDIKKLKNKYPDEFYNNVCAYHHITQ